jgi:hypothetical protein
MDRLPNVKFNKPRIYTNVDSIHTNSKLAKYNVVFKESVTTMISDTIPEEVNDIFVFMKIDSVDELQVLQQKYVSDKNWSKLFFMKFQVKNQSPLSVERIGLLFREFHVQTIDENIVECVYAYNGQTMGKLFRNETVVPDELVKKLLFEGPKKGIDSIMDDAQ